MEFPAHPASRSGKIKSAARILHILSSNQRIKTIARTKRHHYPAVFQFCSTSIRRLRKANVDPAPPLVHLTIPQTHPAE